MIHVDEALLIAAERDRPVTPLRPLTERERTQLDYLDAIVDSSIAKTFDGRPWVFHLPADAVEPHVLEALKRRYEEEGDWQIAILGVGTDHVVSFHLMFAPAVRPQFVTVPSKPKPTLPAVSVAKTGASVEKRLLVRMPTRGRAAQALSVLQAYREMAGCQIMMEVVVDKDDDTMLSAEVVQRLAGLGARVTVGEHKSKIEACNGGSVQDWDILVLASDDMLPVQDGWALHVINGMEKHFPCLDGALHFDDGFQRDHLCTLPVMGRRLWQQFGYVYHPDYKSLFCDREYTDVLKEMGRLAYIDAKLIEHRHHVWGRAHKDAIYERNDALENVDRETFERRKARNFDREAVFISLLICSLPNRRARLKWLVDYLYSQIPDHLQRQVEIIIDDRVEPKVGEKRQALLERARGEYVAFIDDDDGVAHDYVVRLIRAAAKGADCANLEGVLTTRGGKPERFRHSIQFDGWYSKAGVHYRTPNHLNMIKREIALKVGFIAKNVGEDHDFSNRVRPLLKTEATTGETPLYFYWWNPDDSVQKRNR